MAQHLDWRYPDRSIVQLQEAQVLPGRKAEKPVQKEEDKPESESDRWVRERMNETLA